MPKLLPTVMKKNDSDGLNLTFSQMKKAARRLERRCEGWLQEDADVYVMDHSDITGETAVKNVMQDINETNAARRLAA